jgi:hypothetical protein
MRFNVYPQNERSTMFRLIVVCVLCITHIKIFKKIFMSTPEYLPFIVLTHIWENLLYQDASVKVTK